ncbi:MAG TPA: peroxide stress protein YaaA [Pseudonocardia sp.]
MLVLLPPSETKLDGGDGPPLRLEGLSHPELTPLRAQLVDELVKLSGDLDAARAALGLSANQDGEVARNAQLWSSPTTAALNRYTGVLYDALDVRSLRGAAVVRARQRLAVGSALFGLLTADDAVPAYRLSAASTLPGRGTLAATWRPFLAPVLAALAERELVVDLRSGSYAAMAKVPGAVTVTVLTAERRIVSHFNKAHKGTLARLLASSRAEPSDAAAVAGIARRAGMRVERRGTALEIILPA